MLDTARKLFGLFDPRSPIDVALLLDGSAEAQGAFQEFLTRHGLSSHMWVVARKPGPRGG